MNNDDTKRHSKEERDVSTPDKNTDNCGMLREGEIFFPREEPNTAFLIVSYQFLDYL